GAVYSPGGDYGTMLYVSEFDNNPNPISTINSMGEPNVFTTISDSYRLTGLAFSDGNQFGKYLFGVDLRGIIYKITADKKISKFPVTPPTGMNETLAFGHAYTTFGENLFVAPDNAGNIIKITPTGKASVFASGFAGFDYGGVTGLKFSQDNKTLFVTDDKAGIIYAISGQESAGPVLWKFSVVANTDYSGGPALSNPALDKSPINGNWQVAYSQGFYYGSPSVYLKEIGGDLKTIAKFGDSTPQQAGYIFNEAPFYNSPSNEERGVVSLSKGTVAFKISSIGNLGPISGIYTSDGSTVKRVADTTMTLPGSNNLQFKGFGNPSINSGNVVFYGRDEPYSSAQTVGGVYGLMAEYTDNLIEIAQTYDPENSVAKDRYGNLQISYIGQSNFPPYQKDSIYIKYFDSSLGSLVNGSYDLLLGCHQDSPYIYYLSSSYENLSYYAAYNGLNAGIYEGCHGVATLGTIPPEGGRFSTFLKSPNGHDYDPKTHTAIDVIPIEDHAPPLEHWVGFVATTDKESGIYLYHNALELQAFPTLVTGSDLYRVIGGQSVKNLLATSLNDPILAKDGLLYLSLSKDAVKQGSLAFHAKLHSFTALGSSTIDAIILAELCAADLNANVNINQSGFRINRTNKHYLQTVSVRNTGNTDILGPIGVAVENLSSNATLFNKTDSCGQPASAYLEFPLTGNKLSPGELVSVNLEFVNPKNQNITYGARMLKLAVRK
ncbi:MAG: hypothetical protein ABL925_10460, partial [Methylococcales bacterium]